LGEVEIGGISANGATYKRIFHANRKKGFYGDFWQGFGYETGKRSPIWAYSSSGFGIMIPISLKGGKIGKRAFTPPSL
jgi:hypothetical protein